MSPSRPLVLASRPICPSRWCYLQDRMLVVTLSIQKIKSFRCVWCPPELPVVKNSCGCCACLTAVLARRFWQDGNWSEDRTSDRIGPVRTGRRARVASFEDALRKPTSSLGARHIPTQHIARPRFCAVEVLVTKAASAIHTVVHKFSGIDRRCWAVRSTPDAWRAACRDLIAFNQPRVPSLRYRQVLPEATYSATQRSIAVSRWCRRHACCCCTSGAVWHERAAESTGSRKA